MAKNQSNTFLFAGLVAVAAFLFIRKKNTQVAGIGKVPSYTKADLKRLYKRMEDYTGNNDHQEAVRELAKFLGMRDHIVVLNKIIKERDKRGYFPDEYLDVETTIMDETYQRAKMVLPPSDYKFLLNETD